MKLLLILLGILKIIGIVLLVLLGILLFLLLVILLTPIEYEAEGEKRQDMKGWAKIRWLFGLVRIKVVYSGAEGIDISAKVFLFTLFDSKAEPKPEKKRKKKKEQLEPVKKPIPEKEPVPERKDTSPDTKPERKKTETLDMPKKQIQFEQKEAKPKKEEHPSEKPIVRRVKMTEIKEEANAGKQEEKQPEKTEEFGLDYLKRMSYDDKKKLIKACIRVTKRLLKNVLPKNCRGDLKFGTGDPALTGQLLGLGAMIKGILGDNFYVKANFQETMAEGGLWLKGRIFVGIICLALIQFALQKPVWNIIKLYWKGSGEANEQQL